MGLWFFALLKVSTEMIKNNKYLLKINRSHYIVILLDSLKDLELVFSLHNEAKTKFEIFARISDQI